MHNFLVQSLTFKKVKNSEMHDVNFVDSMGFHSKVADSENIKISKLKISAPGDSPNTDGMHISCSTNVNVTDSIIGTGDDCVSIGHGTTDILVSGITCGPGHGIRSGPVAHPIITFRRDENIRDGSFKYSLYKVFMSVLVALESAQMKQM